MTAVVELHDTTVIAIIQNADTVVVRLSASVHRSDGRPGYDPGSCWSQVVDLTFVRGVVEEQPAELPCTLDDGQLLGTVEFDGLIPIPADLPSAIRFDARGLYGERLVIRGSGVRIVPLTEAVYVEAFPGTTRD